MADPFERQIATYASAVRAVNPFLGMPEKVRFSEKYITKLT